MPEYRYIARDGAGRQQSGTVEAESREAAVLQLRGQRLLVLEIAEIKRRDGPRSFSLNPLEYRAIRPVDVERDFHQLAVMLRSGLPILEALRIVAGNSRIAVARVWNKIADRIQQGDSLTEAMMEHKVFDRLTLALIRVGEETGNLDFVLDHASKELERMRNFKRQVISALAYPLFVMVFAIGVAIFMLTTVVPEIKKFLAVLGRKLPPITQALIDTSDWLETHGPYILIGLTVFIVTIVLLRKVPLTRYWLDWLLLKTPLFGRIAQLAGAVAFTRGLGTLFKSGVRIVEALEITEALLSNTWLGRRVAEARRQVLHGESLSKPLGEKFGFPPLLYKMLVVGENAGTLDDILDELTAYFEDAMARLIRTMAAFMEPAVTLIVGGIVGFVYAAFLVAMFSAGGKG
ncbi:type IV pilus assembly protein PilC [Methylomarinovum caldicuralii]|uniref:General secretion pathway protein F n=1 Tax=Methylomarinovum caldicuralii TaxID=438856 RepID=A0AAU9C689_9GAMM|nr:type II secretion system F family protein [Methylomarinovum caldicuralii]BCX82755.1 type IV pilus assembly protein PilC [Methylomarinovum caldicuralii]